MSSLSMQVYWRLPPVIRNIAAAARGRYLRSWRYGPETEHLVAEAIEREHWSAAQWGDWRQQANSRLLERAATYVPYYREQWAARRRRGDLSAVGRLENWPILEKDALRKSPEAFVAQDRARSRMHKSHTSGTTGTPLTLWTARSSDVLWYALFEARCRRWYGVSREDAWANIGGQLIAPVSQQRPPYWVWNSSLHQLYMSSYHLKPTSAPAYFVALKQYRIQYLLGYTSSLFRLAEEALRLKIRIPMRVVVTNAEPLYEVQRAAIGEAFCCPVRESYGMAEAVAAASECEAGRLHLWPEAGIWEVLNDDCNAVRDGETGELISTGLVNMDMPLIRYRTGDRVRLPRRSEPSCKCGRTLPLVESIEGRLDEVLYTADGRQVGRLDPVFKANLPISAAQIIQEHLDELLVQYVPDGEFTKKDERSIVTRLTERLGPMKIVLQPVTEIERGANGKFRGVICRLSDTVKADVIRRSTNAKASCSYR